MSRVSRAAALLAPVLVSVLALLYAWIGATADGWDRAWGLGGAALVLAALLLARTSRPVAAVLLLAGALPLAVATWWSLVTPLLAVLVLVTGAVAIRAPRAVPPGARRRTLASVPH